VLRRNSVKQAYRREIGTQVAERLSESFRQFIGAGPAAKTLVRQNVQPAIEVDAEQPLRNPRPEGNARLKLQGFVRGFNLLVPEL
jgi:hypothetical protein